MKRPPATVIFSAVHRLVSVSELARRFELELSNTLAADAEFGRQRGQCPLDAVEAEAAAQNDPFARRQFVELLGQAFKLVLVACRRQGQYERLEFCERVNP